MDVFDRCFKVVEGDEEALVPRRNYGKSQGGHLRTSDEARLSARSNLIVALCNKKACFFTFHHGMKLNKWKKEHSKDIEKHMTCKVMSPVQVTDAGAPKSLADKRLKANRQRPSR